MLVADPEVPFDRLDGELTELGWFRVVAGPWLHLVPGMTWRQSALELAGRVG
jgi:hypothetical protein